VIDQVLRPHKVIEKLWFLLLYSSNFYYQVGTQKILKRMVAVMPEI